MAAVGSIATADRKKDVMIDAAGDNLSPSPIGNAITTSPYVKGVIVIAERSPNATAMLQIDMEKARLWAGGRGIVYTTSRSFTKVPRARSLNEDEVQKMNGDLAPVEQVKRVFLQTGELDNEGD